MSRLKRSYKKKKIMFYALFVLLIIAIIFINSNNKEYYNDKKHGFSAVLTNNWVYLSNRQMNKYYKTDTLYEAESTQNFEIIFTALKYNEKYAEKNNIPNPSIIILCSQYAVDPKDLVNSISEEIINTQNFKYDGGNEISNIGSLKWQSSYISAEINSLIIFQDYYAVEHNDKTYLIIATSFGNENLYEVYDLLENIKFCK